VHLVVERVLLRVVDKMGLLFGNAIVRVGLQIGRMGLASLMPLVLRRDNLGFFSEVAFEQEVSVDLMRTVMVEVVRDL
jgi:hypothetical protein